VSAKRRLSKLLRVVRGISIAFVAFLGIAYALTDIPSAALKFNTNEAKAKSAGLFTTTDELLATLAVPEGENGAALLKEALDEYEKNYKGLKYFAADNLTMNQEVVLSAYEKFGTSWQKIEQLSKFKYCIFPRDRKPLIDAIFPEFATLRYIAKLAQYRAVIALERNEPKVAAEAWRRGAALALVCDDEHVLIGTLVRIACESIVEESIRKALNQRGQDPAWHAAAWEALQLLDRPHDFSKAMKTEHMFALEGFDTLTRSPGAMGFGDMNNEWRLLRAFSKIPFAGAATNSRIHEIYSEFYTRLGTDPYDVTKISDASTWMDREIDNQKGLSYTVVKILLPVFAQAGRACAKSDAQRNVLMQAIKLLEDPTQKDLPLKDRYTLDSDGKTLRLIVEKDRRVVYSIGPNFKDDGGVIDRPTTGSSRDYDYGVAIPK
jgi:hypothetical protein